MNNDNSGVNTILIVIVLIVIVMGIVWFFRDPLAASVPNDDINVRVDLPNGGNDSINVPDTVTP